jgi:cell division protein FtsA
VQAVVANATAIPLSFDQEILHVVPQSFSLDRQRRMPNPVGMEGSTLEVDVHIVTASSTHINSLVKSVTEAGFEVVDVVYGLLATGEQLVTPEEKELGTLLVDFGGQSLSVGVYAEGGLRYSKELGIGADYITRDLAVGLHTSIATAERLKIAHGLAHVSRLNGDKEIEFPRVDGRTLDRVKPSGMMRFILPRVEEIFEMVARDMEESTYRDLVSAGSLIMTGGGTLMKGITTATEELLGLQTRVGLAHPEQVAGDEKWFSPAYATAMGLLTYANSTRLGSGASRLSSRKKNAWLRRLHSLLADLL